MVSDEILPGRRLHKNEFLILKNGKNSALAIYKNKTIIKIEKSDFKPCHTTPRNAEQAFALSALLDPDIKLVALTGKAGTGKTLISIAAGIEQRSLYEKINYTRAIVPLGKDLGYLPGDEVEKTSPYMQPLHDNLGVLKQNKANENIIQKMLRDEDISTPVISFFRGRTFYKQYLIIDEAQNLTPHEVKTIITRAGEGTKIIFTGDIKQIDTEYLDERTNGLSYIIDRLKNQPLFAYLEPEKG